MMTIGTFLGLIFVTGGSTLLGSAPVLFHKYFSSAKWHWWESFGGGVMMGASIFSLFLPAYQMGGPTSALLHGALAGFFFIFVSSLIVDKIVQNIAHRRAFLFVFVMGLHNIPEGLSVGVDVGAVGWAEAMHLSVAIFIQNLPEGFASSMSFLVSGFSVKHALLANAVTALIEAVSAILGFHFVSFTKLGLPFLLCFAGASMFSVVLGEAIKHIRGDDPDAFSLQGFSVGFVLCAALDLIL